MTEKLEQLQELSTLLSDYAEVLTARSSELPTSPESAASRDALLRIYWLQLNVVKSMHALISDGAPLPKRRLGSTESANPLLRDLKAAVTNSRLKPYTNISELLVNPALTENFEKLYTILGPNNFPDDEDDTPAPPPASR
jgi:hypothetical protein